MNDLFTFAASGFGWLAIAAGALAAAYLAGYFLLRCWGKLRVNAEGWNASGIFFGRLVVLPALGLFGWYQPLLRLESAAAARLFREGGGEQPVSEVVVELIQFS